MSNRRNFIKKSAIATGSLMTVSQMSWATSPVKSNASDINIIGPKEGYSPQIGTLVSMMNWMRETILYPVQGMTVKDLDYLYDDDSNSIGAMLLHLAATERYYQLNTFDNMRWGSWSKAIKAEWDAAMNLGAEGRKKIKGNNLDFYLDKLSEVRENTLTELAKRDDDWLMKIDEDWGWRHPTNNYCKWFHVVEHESNHNGQIKYLKSRVK